MKATLTFIIMLCIIGLSNRAFAQEVKINNNMVVESDGTVRMDGSATVYDDLMVYPDATTRSGSNDPTYTIFMKNGSPGTTQGVFLWAFSTDTEEELYFTVQIPHSYKVGTDLLPHVHWTTFSGTPTTTNVTWGLEYTVIAIGGIFPYTKTIETTSVIPSIGPPSGTNQHLISAFPAISGSGLDISTVLVCRLYRKLVSSDFSGSAGLLGFDFHFEHDTFGSRTQWSK